MPKHKDKMAERIFGDLKTRPDTGWLVESLDDWKVPRNWASLGTILKDRKIWLPEGRSQPALALTPKDAAMRSSNTSWAS